MEALWTILGSKYVFSNILETIWVEYSISLFIFDLRLYFFII
jgi:hypothetical protein